MKTPFLFLLLFPWLLPAQNWETLTPDLWTPTWIQKKKIRSIQVFQKDIDESGRGTLLQEWHFDAQGRDSVFREINNSVSFCSEYHYDANSNLVRRLRYPEFVDEGLPTSRGTIFQYDNKGNCILELDQLIEANGSPSPFDSLFYHYDDQNRPLLALQSRSRPDTLWNWAHTQDSSVLVTYRLGKPLGQIVVSIDSKGQIKHSRESYFGDQSLESIDFKYEKGRLVEKIYGNQWTIGSQNPSKRIKFSYDRKGFLREETVYTLGVPIYTLHYHYTFYP